jgi:hypothetical protein
MNKRTITLLGSGLIALIIGGQTNAQDKIPEKPSKYAKITPITKARFKIARSDAEQFAEDLLIGMKTFNYPLFIKNMRQNFVTEKQFTPRMKSFKKKRGVYVDDSRQYLGFLNRGDFYEFLWKITLKRVVKTSKGETKELYFETLLSIIVCEIDGKDYVMAFNFQ